jgi:branched-chain amino acid transport system ATP-binding protein
LLELTGLRVSYGRIEVVRGVDLHLGIGEAVGIVGPNGAGKTAMLRAICGLIRPSGGEVRFEGTTVTGLAPEQIARRGLALVPEGRQIFKTLTVVENLQLGAAGRSAADRLVERMLERFPILAQRSRQRADRLSGGEQQQLAIARALLGDPKLLVLDEPSLGLSPKMIDNVYSLLQELREDGVTILLVEQNVARTLAFSDRCLLLSRGRVRAEGTAEELRRTPRVLATYLGAQP